MKLIYPNMQLSMRLMTGMLNFLVIERKDVFELATIALKDAAENKADEVMLYDDESQQNFSKIADVIFTSFEITYEKREIQKKLFGVLQGISETQDIISEFAEVNGQMLGLLEKLNFESEYDISFAEDFDFSSLMKNYSVHMREPEGRFAERAIEYMVNVKRLLAKDAFIFVNCDAYIPAEDYAYLEECAKQYELMVLFINSRQISLPVKANECIIDMDLCEIH